MGYNILMEIDFINKLKSLKIKHEEEEKTRLLEAQRSENQRKIEEQKQREQTQQENATRISWT